MRFADRLPRSQPLFAQDCKHCTFLGTYAGADLYHCACWGSNPTVIARRSNEISDYAPGLAVARAADLAEHEIPELRVAYLIAKDLGLIDDDPEQR